MPLLKTICRGLESDVSRASVIQLNGAELMEPFATTFAMVAALNAPMELQPIESENWCIPGTVVMITDGREGFVSSIDGDICRIIASGEKYVTLLPHFLVEPVYPQPYAPRAYR